MKSENDYAAVANALRELKRRDAEEPYRSVTGLCSYISGHASENLRQEHTPNSAPECFGDYISGNVQAERDCDRCKFFNLCHQQARSNKQ